jgi:hypothetical protein
MFKNTAVQPYIEPVQSSLHFHKLFAQNYHSIFDKDSQIICFLEIL